MRLPDYNKGPIHVLLFCSGFLHLLFAILFHFLSYVYSVTKKGISVNTEIPFHVMPQAGIEPAREISPAGF